MPIYVYICECGKRKDEFRKIADRDNFPECHGLMSRKIMPTMVQADIQPYFSVAIDKERGTRMEVSSRKQHREFLRRNDYVEVPDFKPPKREVFEEAPTYNAEQMKKQGWIEESL